MTRTFILFVALSCLADVSHAQSANIKSLFSVYADLDDMCSGWPGDDKHIAEVCDTREKLRQALIRMGYCKGKYSQSRSDFEWHRCGPDSVR